MLNANGTELRICTACAITHYENCTTCYGFGVYGVELKSLPVTAIEAHDKKFRGITHTCPECHSDSNGIRI